MIIFAYTIHTVAGQYEIFSSPRWYTYRYPWKSPSFQFSLFKRSCPAIDARGWMEFMTTTKSGVGMWVLLMIITNVQWACPQHENRIQATRKVTFYTFPAATRPHSTQPLTVAWEEGDARIPRKKVVRQGHQLLLHSPFSTAVPYVANSNE